MVMVREPSRVMFATVVDVYDGGQVVTVEAPAYGPLMKLGPCEVLADVELMEYGARVAIATLDTVEEVVVLGVVGVDSENMRWIAVSGAPVAELGRLRDWAIDTATGQTWEKTLGGWVSRGSLKGPKGDRGDDGDDGATGLRGESGGAAYYSDLVLNRNPAFSFLNPDTTPEAWTMQPASGVVYDVVGTSNGLNAPYYVKATQTAGSRSRWTTSLMAVRPGELITVRAIVAFAASDAAADRASWQMELHTSDAASQGDPGPTTPATTTTTRSGRLVQNNTFANVTATFAVPPGHNAARLSIGALADSGVGGTTFVDNVFVYPEWANPSTSPAVRSLGQRLQPLLNFPPYRFVESGGRIGWAKELRLGGGLGRGTLVNTGLGAHLVIPMPADGTSIPTLGLGNGSAPVTVSGGRITMPNGACALYYELTLGVGSQTYDAGAFRLVGNNVPNFEPPPHWLLIASYDAAQLLEVVWGDGLTQDAWHYVGTTDEPAFENAWVNSSASEDPAVANSFEQAKYRLENDGTVTMRGTVRSGTFSTTEATGRIFTLPGLYRPVARAITAQLAGNQVGGRVDVYGSGSVVAVAVGSGGSNAFLTLNASWLAAPA